MTLSGISAHPRHYFKFYIPFPPPAPHPSYSAQILLFFPRHKILVLGKTESQKEKGMAEVEMAR